MTARPVSVPSQTTSKRNSKMPASAQSLNHLLNFTLPPRQAPQSNALPRRSRRSHTHHAIWNKERFVNAQYRFVMDPSGDYTVHFADPDIYFEWNDILQIIIPRSSALASANSSSSSSDAHEGHTTCPICLSPPTAPRMTKCGHVFCFPCILHYFTTSENKWARCPICFDSINEYQLKSVKWFDGPHFLDDDPDDHPNGGSSSSVAEDAVPKAGSLLRLRLMQRPQITTLALPRSSTWPSDLIPPHQAPFHFLPDIFDYSKFMLATPEYLVDNLQADLESLEIEHRTLTRMHDDIGLLFVDSAVQKVRHQIEKSQALDNPVLRGRIEKVHRDHQDIMDRQASRQQKHDGQTPVTEVPEELLAARSWVAELASPPSAARSSSRPRRNINPPPPSTSTYYYYQGASGLPIFLHPLDIKILLSHFNSYQAFPDTVTVRVEAVTEGTVNDDLRKRCKYLAHMPASADVVFVEADLLDVVGSEGLRPFETALKSRSSRRKEKNRKDDRARARAEEREREREQHQTATAWNHASFITTADYAPDSPASDHISLPESSPPPQVPEPTTGAWGNRSFASATASSRNAPVPGHARQAEIDEWDIDAAWHELETRNINGGGRKKRANKLLVLGGGGRRR